MPPEPPLPPATFYILFALVNGDKHGYAILKEARELSDDRFQIGPATLYTTIPRLVDSDWIKPIASSESEDPRRRYYRLTRAGRIAVQNELARMEGLVRKAKSMRIRPAESSL